MQEPRLVRHSTAVRVGPDGAEFIIDGNVEAVMPLRYFREFVESCRVALLEFETDQRKVVRLANSRPRARPPHAA